jgi:hypothetical protein
VWNNAEAPEPPANLTAALKGAVIHRFCERYSREQNAEECLRRSFDEVVRFRQAELADRLVEIDTEAAIKDLLPLALNYLSSDVFARVEKAREAAIAGNRRCSSTTVKEGTDQALLDSRATAPGSEPSGEPGIWSELSFRLRRPLGVVSGAIDKLLVTNSNDDQLVEIIDFKTNRITKTLGVQGLGAQASHLPPVATLAPKTSSGRSSQSQFAFNFDAQSSSPVAETYDDNLRAVAHDYQLQMQSYALAIRELIPSLKNSQIRVTLHFLEPNLEFHIADELLESSACEEAIDAAMLDIVSSSEPTHFPVKPASHCRTCSFLKVCSAGREFIKLASWESL